jgi:hypothetical protein
MIFCLAQTFLWKTSSSHFSGNRTCFYVLSYQYGNSFCRSLWSLNLFWVPDVVLFVQLAMPFVRKVPYRHMYTWKCDAERSKAPLCTRPPLPHNWKETFQVFICFVFLGTLIIVSTTLHTHISSWKSNIYFIIDLSAIYFNDELSC